MKGPVPTQWRVLTIPGLHTHIHTYIFTHIHTQTHTYSCTLACLLTYTYTHAHFPTLMHNAHTHTNEYSKACRLTYAYMHINTYAHMHELLWRSFYLIACQLVAKQSPEPFTAGLAGAKTQNK